MKKPLLLSITLVAITCLCSFAPKQNETSSPYSNPAINQGLQPRDTTGHFVDGNIVRNIPDEKLTKEIEAILKTGDYVEGYQNITYSVNDGIVTLNGHVSVPGNKIKLEDRIKQIKGVVLIDNQISISDSDNKIIGKF